jgi:hypothetical protein
MACRDFSPEPVAPGKVILLAGAGASVHLKLPTLEDLMEAAVLGNDIVADRIRDTRDAIQAAPQRRTKAIFEELIVQLRYYLKMAETLRFDYLFKKEFGEMPSEVKNGAFAQKWKDALTRCYRVLLTHYGPAEIAKRKDSAEFKTTLQLLKELAGLNGGTLHVFTTNYDCSYQVLASNCQDISFMTHIDNKHGRFSDNWFSARPDLDDSELPKVYVHRLHGCVGWFTSEGGLTEEQYGSGSDLEVIDDNKLPTMCLKLVASQLVGTNQVFISAFEELCDHLREVDVLLVWGYSFRDLEVLRVINQAFSQRRSFPVLFVDPYLDEKTALGHIRSSLHDAPVPLDLRFRPKKIPWITNDGHRQLITAVIESLKAEIRKKEEGV